MAEVIDTYLNPQVPPLSSINGISESSEPTLMDQARGGSLLMLAVDEAPVTKQPRAYTDDDREMVAMMYGEGQSMRAISRGLHMGWSTVARLLDESGVERRPMGGPRRKRK